MMERISMTAGLFLLVFALALPAGVPLLAQEDYPLPPGSPESWGQGKPHTMLLKQGRERPVNPFSAQEPRGYEGQERGESQEVYTGTRAMRGGMAGTGIEAPGSPPQQYR